MSASFNPEDFQSPQNITVPIVSTNLNLTDLAVAPETLAITQISSAHGFAGKLIAKFKIVNESATEMFFRILNVQAPLRTIPQITSTTVEEYTFYLEIRYPDSNRKSYVELDLIDPKDSMKRNSDVLRGAA